MSEEIDSDKAIFSHLLSLRKNIPGIQGDFVNECIINEYHSYLNELGKFLKRDLSEYRIKEEQIERNIYDEDKGEFGFNIKMIAVRDTTGATAEISREKRYCNKVLLLIKLDALLLVFEKEIESILKK